MFRRKRFNPGFLPHVPTPKTHKKVRSLVECGYKLGDIARYMNLSMPCLEKYYHKELKNGEVDLIKLAKNTVVRNTKRGDEKAAEYLLNTRGSHLGWGNKQNITSNINMHFDLSKLTDDELNQFELLQRKAKKIDPTQDSEAEQSDG